MHAEAPKPPTWYWVVAVILFLWMLMGIAAFAMDLMSTPESIAAAYSAEQVQLYNARPSWLMYVYALATIAGLVGGLGLLLRKAWAIPALLVSFITVIFQMGYTLFGLDAIGILGAAIAVPFPVFICVMGGVAFWFARMAKGKGILR
jgi:hypothetical protein